MKEKSNEELYVTERLVDSIGAVPMHAVAFTRYTTKYADDESVKLLIIPQEASQGEKSIKVELVNDLTNIISGQELLISLCNLYQTVNDAPFSQKVQLITDWCTQNIHPYNISDIFDSLKVYRIFKNCSNTPISVNSDDPMERLLNLEESDEDSIKKTIRSYRQKVFEKAAFLMDDFIHDMNLIVNATMLYRAICALHFDHDDSLAKLLYHPESNDDEGISAFGLDPQNPVIDEHTFWSLANLFPKLTSEIQYDEKNGLLKASYIQDSIFDVAWNTLAELTAATFGKKPYSPKSALRRCSICGKFFIRHSANQKYCGSPECEKIRNQRKALNYYHGYN